MKNTIMPVILVAIQLMIIIPFGVAENWDSQPKLFLCNPPFWEGSVNMIKNTTFKLVASGSGNNYTIGSTTALGALNKASEMGNFVYTIDDQWYNQFGSLLLDSIAGKKGEGFDGWQYWVNYPHDSRPYVGADQYEIKEGDVVDFFYGDFDVTPNSSLLLIRIYIQISEDNSSPKVIILRPASGIYIVDRKIFEISGDFAIVIGEITIIAEVFDELTRINKVEFFIDANQKSIDKEHPYEWMWNSANTGKHTLHVKGYDEVGNPGYNETILWVISV